MWPATGKRPGAGVIRRPRHILGAWFAILLATQSAEVRPSPDVQDGCGRLEGHSSGSAVVVSAATVSASGNFPAVCKVEGRADKSIGFDLRLPIGLWNGKLLFQGYGALDGAPPAFTHSLTLGSPGSSPPLARGYAVVTTDTGHVLPPGASVADYGDWAIDDPVARENWAHRATHLVVQASKDLIQLHYGRPATRAYYHGCSGGGRHAVMAAQRYPEDFDGVVAGAPWLAPTGQSIAMHWQVDATHLLATKLRVVTKAVLAACDGIDGLVDGIIQDPATCDFDPTVLTCAENDAVDCLTAEQVRVLRSIYDGPATAAGQRLFPGYVRGGESRWIPAVVPPPNGRSANDLLQDAYFRGFVIGATYNGRSLDIDESQSALEVAAALVDVDPDLTRYERAGGKVLMWHGWHDARISPWNSIEFYERVKAIGRSENEDLNRWLRLFMAPGVEHCTGGVGPNQFDALGALDEWVESAVPPDRLIATGTRDGSTSMSRPLCPYPQQATYLGTGSIYDATSFDCK